MVALYLEAKRGEKTGDFFWRLEPYQELRVQVRLVVERNLLL